MLKFSWFLSVHRGVLMTDASDVLPILIPLLVAGVMSVAFCLTMICCYIRKKHRGEQEVYELTSSTNNKVDGKLTSLTMRLP